jgi:crossover junction endodeoxyribonuclease RusA
MTPDLVLRITIPGHPVPKGRPRFARSGHTYTPPRTRKAEDAVAMSSLTRRHAADHWPVTGPIAMTLAFHVRRPADLDNLVKLVADALQHVVYADDRQIVQLHASRHDKADNPRTEIAIHTLT